MDAKARGTKQKITRRLHISTVLLYERSGTVCKIESFKHTGRSIVVDRLVHGKFYFPRHFREPRGKNRATYIHRARYQFDKALASIVKGEENRARGRDRGKGRSLSAGKPIVRLVPDFMITEITG